MERKRQKRKGFTLVELLVVIIILSLLAGFVAPKMLSRVGKAKKDLAKPKMTSVLPCNVKGIGFIENSRIAVSPGKDKADGIAAFDAFRVDRGYLFAYAEHQ